VLGRITGSGINPQSGVAAWPTAISGVIGARLAAVVVMILDATATLLSGPIWTQCLEIAGYSGQVDLVRPVAAAIAIATIGTALMVTVLAGRRIGQTLRKLRSHSHQHAMAARVVVHPPDGPMSL
jgi:hypothetical protein